MQPWLGTFVEIQAEGASGVSEAVNEAFASIERVHRCMNFHDSKSDLSRLNREASLASVLVDSWTWEVIKSALMISENSNGWFDVTASSWMNDEEGSRADWRKVELLPENRIRFHDAQVRIDLSGIAKGFAVDRAVEVLMAKGMRSGLVNAGGDLRGFGDASRKVRLRDSRKGEVTAREFDLGDFAVATSGGFFRDAENYQQGVSPFISPRAGKYLFPTESVSVKAPTAMLADALTKVVLVGGDEAMPVLKRLDAALLA